MPYETPNATTDAEMIALKAALEPRKIQPKMTVSAVVKFNAFRGRSNLAWTLAKYLENGNPPSLEDMC